MGSLRLALALAVLLSHMPGAAFTFISGGLAVQSFFIISGFYMALVLEGKYADRGLFYSNRLLRLGPMYFVMAAICAVSLFGFGISVTATPEVFQAAFSNPATAAVMAFENLFVVGQELLFWFRLPADGSLVFDSTGALPTEDTSVAWQALLVPQSWSLSMELMFYAMAPFLARMRWTWLVALAAASIALRFGGHLLPVDFGLWQGRLFPTALFLFIMGMLSYRILPLALRSPKWLGGVLTLAMLALIVLQPKTLLTGEAARWTVYFALAAVTPFVFSAFKDNAFDRWIGDLSYPIYLCHLFVIALVLTFEPPQAMWVAIAGSLLMAAAFVILIDRPVDRWRQKRVRDRAGSVGGRDEGVTDAVAAEAG